MDVRFLAHPAFSVFDARVRERLTALQHFPAPNQLKGLAEGVSSAACAWFDFELQDQLALDQNGGFDRSIAKTSRIPTRAGSYHDLLGALVWLHFPELKTAIHRVQLNGDRAARGPGENAATHLDESGVLVLSSEQLVFESLAALEWRETFWDRRAELLRTTRFLSVGHGLLDSLRAPHPKLMGKALFVRVRAEKLALSASELRTFVDRELAARLPRFLSDPSALHPLPVLGVPTWSVEQSAAYYEDARYFRRARQRARPTPALSWLELG